MPTLVLRPAPPSTIQLVSGGGGPTYGAAPTFEGGSTISSVFGTQTMSLTLPAGIQAGDVMLVFCMWAQVGTIEAPSFTSGGDFTGYTFTEHFHLDGSDYVPEGWVWTTPLVGDESGDTLTVQMSKSTSWTLGLAIVRGSNPDALFDTIPAAIRNSAGTATFPEVTPTTDNHLLMTWQAAVNPQDGAGGFAVPTDFTEGFDGGGTDQFRNMGLAYREDHTGTDPYTPSSVSMSGTANQVLRLTLCMPALPAPATTVELWDGSAWVPASVDVWDGSSWVPAQAELWDGTAWLN